MAGFKVVHYPGASAALLPVGALNAPLLPDRVIFALSTDSVFKVHRILSGHAFEACSISSWSPFLFFGEFTWRVCRATIRKRNIIYGKCSREQLNSCRLIRSRFYI